MQGDWMIHLSTLLKHYKRREIQEEIVFAAQDKEIAARLGTPGATETVKAASEDLMDYSERLLRRETEKLPDGSYEAAIHRTLERNALFLFRDEEESISALREPRGHRAIGVVYDPRTEHWGNYVPTALPQRYDAFMYIEESEAVDPLHMPVRMDGEVPETFPTGQ